MKTVLLAASLCLLVIGCGRAAGPVTIGAAGPWTRPVGITTKQGIELAVAEINAAGGVRGRELRLAVRDDSGDGARAAAIAQQFVESDTVLGVIGDVNSGPTIAAAKVYDGHLALIATSATSPQLSGISPWVFRIISSDSVNGVAIARFVSALGRQRAAVIYENDSYGRGLADAFRKSFTGEIVAMDPIGSDATNLEPYVAYYKTRAPDIVFAVGGGISGIALLREARRQRLATDFVGGDGWTAIVSDTAAAEGVYVGAPFTPTDPRAEVQHFVAAYRARYGTTPDDKAALGYDAAHLLARAIAEAGPHRAAVRRYLASLTPATAYHGVTGMIRFQPSGDPDGKGLTMTRVRRGALVLAEQGQ
ncbi:MAG: ABC transporter substrate-binding protein [Gemmatimonadaceae bacterium]|nr:ABC transporter substrate-binding protein [Gemmatimonadaceae bacterium]